MIEKKISLNGVEHPFRFTTNALLKLEEILGVEVWDIVSDAQKIRSIKTIRATAFCGVFGGYDFNDKDCPITIEQMGRHMELTPESMEFYITQLTEGILGKRKGEKKPKAVVKN